MNEPPLQPGPLKLDFQDLQYRFQERTFGEEWARINALPFEERRRQVAEIIDAARRHGYREEKPATGVTR